MLPFRLLGEPYPTLSGASFPRIYMIPEDGTVEEANAAVVGVTAVIDLHLCRQIKRLFGKTTGQYL